MKESRVTARTRLAIPALLALVVASRLSLADPSGDAVIYLRVGTGPPGQTHFDIGNQIANASSAPPGLPPCGRGGSCGVPGLIAAASATSGSAANVEAIGEGRLDAALTQADVPYWAATGSPPFRGRPITNLRAVANVGTDLMHVVVLRDGPIHGMRDLKGKRISVGETGSGTQIHALQLLSAFGIKDNEVKLEMTRGAVAADAMLAGRIDAFFVMDAAPTPSLTELAKTKPIRLLPLTGPPIDKIRRADPLLFASPIEAGSYQGIDAEVPTLAIGLTLVVASSLPDDLVYQLTQALWQPTTVAFLNEHPHGAPVGPESALSGLGLVLHPGAQKYYQERKTKMR